LGGFTKLKLAPGIGGMFPGMGGMLPGSGCGIGFVTRKSAGVMVGGGVCGT
jgi:hypothetical protein